MSDAALTRDELNRRALLAIRIVGEMDSNGVDLATIAQATDVTFDEALRLLGRYREMHTERG